MLCNSMRLGFKRSQPHLDVVMQLYRNFATWTLISLGEGCMLVSTLLVVILEETRIRYLQKYHPYA